MSCAELIARVLKTPIIVVLVPMLIPLIPGGHLYYTTVNLVQANTEEAAYFLRLVASEAGGMAFAIILETSLTQLIFRIGKHRRGAGKNGGSYEKNGQN